MEDMIEDVIVEKFKKNVWLDILKEISKEKKFLVGAIICSVSIGIFEVFTAFLTRHIIDVFVVKKNILYFTPLLIFAIVLSILCYFITFFYILFASHIEFAVIHNLRVKVFNKYQNLPLSFYDSHSVGHLMARITSDIVRIGDVLSWGIVDGMWQIVILVFTFIAMFILSTKLALITLCIVPLIIPITMKIEKLILDRNRHVSSLNSQLIATYNENINGCLVAKTLCREELNDADFASLSQKMKTASIRAARTMAFMPFIVFGIASFANVLVSMMGSNDVMNGALTIGTLVAFSALLTHLIDPLSWFANLFTWIISTQPSVERVIAMLEEPIEIVDSDEAISVYNDVELREKVVRGEILFDDVSFEYKKDEPILKHFNLKVKPGETIALVGATGAGKSTIVNLFCHFYLPTSGSISMGSLDYKNIPQKWIYDNLGYVLQTPYLFTGSIMENIRYGNKNATDEEVIDALKLVGADSFIKDLKDGYHTYLGEDGATLSTGQKQLLSLARILVRNPQFFVLDEATSYIDSQTEQIVQKAIELTLSGRTSFVIAHRLSTIRNASKICVIDKGEMVECGTHEELLAKEGAYYEFYKNQTENR